MLNTVMPKTSLLEFLGEATSHCTVHGLLLLALAVVVMLLVQNSQGALSVLV